MLYITKEFKFEAAHQLPYHKGKCARLHGHSYRVQITVAGDVKPVLHLGPVEASDAGMVMDFYELSAAMKPIIEEMLDHHSLNDILPNPTAENLVLYLVNLLEPKFFLAKVRVYETETSWAEWICPQAY